MSIAHSKIMNVIPYKMRQMISKQESLVRVNGDQKYNNDDGEDENCAANESLLHNKEKYKYKIKIGGRINQVPKILSKTPEPSDEILQQKIEKLEIINQLLAKKNHLLEQSLEKSRRENKTLKNIVTMVYENKDSYSDEWKYKFEEAIKGLNLLEKERSFKRVNAYDMRKVYSQGVMGFKNSNIVKQLSDLDQALAKRISTISPSPPKYDTNTNKNIYEEVDGKVEDQTIKYTLSQAIFKIKEMEHKIASYEQKNRILEHKLEVQKQIKENSYNSKSKHDKNKLLNESYLIQRDHQDVIKNRIKLNNSSYTID